MTQPSQVFPPWLTPSASVVTNAAGVPVATETSIVYLPLTYFGPSIPLGSLWIFGGSTSPASTSSVTSTPLTTTAIPSFTTTATTTTPTTFSSTSASISISNTATPTFSTTPTSNLSSASPTNSSLPSTPTTSLPSSSSAAQLAGLTKGQLVGVIVASVLGLIFVFVLALFLCLWCKGRRNRRQFATLVPPEEDGDYDVLSPSDVEGYRMPRDAHSAPEGHRVPGEGSPRHSGDEASSFLRESRVGPTFAETSAAGAAASAAIMSQVPAAMAVSYAIPRIPPPTNNSNSSGSRSSGSHASGFGVLLDRPGQEGLGILPSMPEHSQARSSVLSDADMERLNQENVLPDDPDMYEDGEYTGAYAYAPDPLLSPPPILDPDSLHPDSSALHPDSSTRMPDQPEAEILMAQRRRVASMVGSHPPELPELPEFGELNPRPSRSLLGAIGLGLGGLANFGRRSWFRNVQSHRYTPDFTIEPFTEKDLEMGQAMLSPDSIVDDRGRGVGTSLDDTRPKSSSSARSGTSAGTVYHDAHSSVPSTPLLPPLPRAVTPVAVPGEPSMTGPVWITSPPSGPPAYDDRNITGSPGVTDNLNLSLDFAPGSDILDLPAPAALPHFTSVSSLKETASNSSLGIKIPSFPPGLDTIRPVGWSDVATEVTASSPAASAFGGIFSGLTNNSLSSSGRITIDLLEDAPPDAELGWRSIASAGFGDAGRRGTFGLLIDQAGFMSEQGSLHSMRSHINSPARSTGSAPASRRDGSSSIGSASSRPSAHSLARTGSISSDGRRRNHTNSPTLSALGGFSSSQIRPSPLSNSSSSNPLDSSVIIGAPPSAHVSPDKMSTIRSLGSASVATVMDSSFGTVRAVDRSTSPLSASFPLNTPWAAGLDNDWTPAA
ncbi:hypothetical protein BYT27DRAFT_7231005 [Phlegmacium glaucopus]|nr:hypothetical protein BYT27DRAFT_7231005 [Phlegmacium glaucopus]